MYGTSNSDSGRMAGQFIPFQFILALPWLLHKTCAVRNTGCPQRLEVMKDFSLGKDFRKPIVLKEYVSYVHYVARSNSLGHVCVVKISDSGRISYRFSLSLDTSVQGLTVLQTYIDFVIYNQPGAKINNSCR